VTTGTSITCRSRARDSSARDTGRSSPRASRRWGSRPRPPPRPRSA
jgi:hypothetical protein